MYLPDARTLRLSQVRPATVEEHDRVIRRVPAGTLAALGYGLYCHERSQSYWIGSSDPHISDHDRWCHVAKTNGVLGNITWWMVRSEYEMDERFSVSQAYTHVRSSITEAEMFRDLSNRLSVAMRDHKFRSQADQEDISVQDLIAYDTLLPPRANFADVRFSLPATTPDFAELHDLIHHYDEPRIAARFDDMPRDLLLRMRGFDWLIKYLPAR